MHMRRMHLLSGSRQHLGLIGVVPRLLSEICCLHIRSDRHLWFNPFTLRAAKTGLTILMIFFLQKHFLENI